MEKATIYYDIQPIWGIELCENDNFEDSIYLNIGITNFDFGFNINTDPIIFNKDVNYIGSINTNQGKNDPVINIIF